MNPYSRSFNRATQKALEAALRIEPHWSLAGRAALWFRTFLTGPVNTLGMVWHRQSRLGNLSERVRQELAAVGLDVGILQKSGRRLWLGASEGESSCLVKLSAEPEPPLAAMSQIKLHGHFIHLESWRDLSQMTLCSLYERRTPEDLGDLYLLLRREGWRSLEQALRDAIHRDPRFDPEQLARSLDRQGISEADPPPGVSLEELGRFKHNLAIRLLVWARSH